MDFALSPEQAELAGTVRSVLTKQADPDAAWSTLCDQIGVPALAIPEKYDGVGATFFETAVVLEELGRAIAPAPLLATAVATEALLAGGSAEAKERLLPRIAGGEVATLVTGDGPVLDADRATILLAIDGDDLVEVTGATATWVESMDQTIRLATVDRGTGTSTPVGDGAAALARAELVGAAASAALAAGLCRRALDMTVAYSKERVQFGRPIGSFQALKHRMADMLARTELTRSVAWSAAYALAQGADDAAEQVHAAASYALDSAQHLAGECIQLHGGIAITWEHDAHLVFKRAHALGRLFGAAHAHRAALSL
ncbi:MAG TPA: acyl-CoA dehydrogenase family protein [Nocardioides sp.]|nr:acyl-CoA dehydrogenase family protein [Nocardioides sp.]